MREENEKPFDLRWFVRTEQKESYELIYDYEEEE